MPRSMFYHLNLAASTKTANLLAGDVNEFVPYDALVTVYGTMIATGIAISVFADSDLLVDDKQIVAIKTSVLLDTNSDVIDQFEVEAGTRLALYLRETAGVATTDGATAIDIQPL